MINFTGAKIPVVNVGIYTSVRQKIQNTINAINSDLTKVIEYNKIARPDSKFIVIDKAQGKAMLYQGEEILDTFDIGVGETYGDSLNDVLYNYKNKTFSSTGKTTPSGEFKTERLPNVCINMNDYVSSNNKLNVILLNGVTHPADYQQNTMIALHQLPNNEYEKRLSILDNGTSGRKSFSTGCVNLRSEDFERLATQIPEETPVYILPEEAGNSLQLVELPNGKLWFKTKYKDKERANALDLAIKHYFHLN